MKRSRQESEGGRADGFTTDFTLDKSVVGLPKVREAEEEAMYTALTRIMCMEIAHEVHREAHTGILTVDHLYQASALKEEEGAAVGAKRRSADNTKDATNVSCHVCGRQVAISRFAPHLDKCMLGARGGVGGSSSRGGAGTRTPSPVPTPQQQQQHHTQQQQTSAAAAAALTGPSASLSSSSLSSSLSSSYSSVADAAAGAASFYAPPSGTKARAGKLKKRQNGPPLQSLTPQGLLVGNARDK